MPNPFTSERDPGGPGGWRRGAVVQVAPLSLLLDGFTRSDFFVVTLTFPLAAADRTRLIGAVQWTTVYGQS